MLALIDAFSPISSSATTTHGVTWDVDAEVNPAYQLPRIEDLIMEDVFAPVRNGSGCVLMVSMCSSSCIDPVSS
jgi:hypothetical protein